MDCICVYCPHSKKEEDIRRNYYENLERYNKSLKTSQLTVALGDFNVLIRQDVDWSLYPNYVMKTLTY